MKKKRRRFDLKRIVDMSQMSLLIEVNTVAGCRHKRIKYDWSIWFIACIVDVYLSLGVLINSFGWDFSSILIQPTCKRVLR